MRNVTLLLGRMELVIVELNISTELDTQIYLFFMQVKELSERSRSTLATPIVFLGVAGLPAPRRLATAPTRHRPASLIPPTP